MTPTKKAIEILKAAIAEVEWDYPMDYAVAFETAIEALEKQVPAQVDPTAVSRLKGHKAAWLPDFATVECPSCSYTMITHGEKMLLRKVRTGFGVA